MNLDLKIIIYLVLLLVPPGIYTYKSYKCLPFEYDVKLIRRIYYITAIIYIYIFYKLFNNEISNLNIFKIDGINTSFLNMLLVVLLLFILSIIWENMFITCRSFNNVKFKDIEITVEELKEVKYVDKLQSELIDTLYAVLNAKIKMLKFIDYYVANKDLDPQKSYENIIKEYSKKRPGVESYFFLENLDGMNEMKKVLKIKNEQFSSIMFVINIFGFCNPPNFRKKNYIFTRIKTKYIDDDIIVVLKSNLLVDKEYLVLIEIINYFELKIDLEILQLNSEENECEVLYE